ncbi:MAG: GNAT family N-acetyltransferase [Deltaproteobacteria bacterium]|nr:GNAT family N-acetyltransferase [Deltaproteobacteria bacterium]
MFTTGGSKNFKDHFASLTFEKRMQAVFRKDHFAIFADADGAGYGGYCIASVEKNRGEVDSLFVNPACRKKGVGAGLMRVALEWLDGKGCAEIYLSVAEGNESVLEYYKQFGFYKRFDLLERKRHDNGLYGLSPLAVLLLESLVVIFLDRIA